MSAFSTYEIVPDVLTDVSSIKTRTTLFGESLDWPLMLAPTGLTRMFHGDAELAVARAAAKHGLLYSLSTLGTTRLEALAQAFGGPKVFQIYIFKDRGLTAEFVARCKAAGFHGLALTVDTPVAGNRERDRVNGLSLPPRLTLRSMLSFAAHPFWSVPALGGSKFDFANVSHRVDALAAGPMSLFDYIGGQFDRSLTWADVEWLAHEWGGPLAIKGCDDPGRREARDRLRCERRDDLEPWRAPARRHSSSDRSNRRSPRDAGRRSRCYLRWWHSTRVGRRKSSCAWRYCLLNRKAVSLWPCRGRGSRCGPRLDPASPGIRKDTDSGGGQ